MRPIIAHPLTCQNGESFGEFVVEIVPAHLQTETGPGASDRDEREGGGPRRTPAFRGDDAGSRSTMSRQSCRRSADQIEQHVRDTEQSADRIVPAATNPGRGCWTLETCRSDSALKGTGHDLSHRAPPGDNYVVATTGAGRCRPRPLSECEP